MIIDHTHPLYVKKRKEQGNDKYNGAYYYSKEIVKNIIPELIDKTDRNWITVRIPELYDHPDHSIVFIHNNRNPNYYSYLKRYHDMILVCSTPHTYENMKFFGTPIYLPLSVDVKQVEKYRKNTKLSTMCYAGREMKMNNHVPKGIRVLSGMPQSKLLKEMSDYIYVYAVGRTAIQAKILGCKVLPYDNMYPDPSVWQILDNHDAAKILLKKLNEIDGKIK